MIRRLCSVALVGLIAPMLATAQPVVKRVPATPSCGNCRIELTRIASFGGANDSVLLWPGSAAIRDARKNYYAWSATRGVLIVYDSAGRFTRTIGRQGRGPGEFAGSSGQLIVGAGDSLYVQSQFSMHAFSPGYDYIRTFHLPGGFYGKPISVPGARFLAPHTLGTAPGEPLHVLDGAGNVIRSFGKRADDPGRVCAACGVRNAALSKAGDRAWVVANYRYVVEEWSLNGAPLRFFEITDSPWLPSDLSRRFGKGEVRMSVTLPAVAGVWEDERGLVWVFGLSPEKLEVPATTQRGVGRVVPGKPRDTVIEILDPAAGRILASRRVKGTLVPMGHGLLYGHIEDADGFQTIEVWRLTLIR